MKINLDSCLVVKFQTQAVEEIVNWPALSVGYREDTDACDDEEIEGRRAHDSPRAELSGFEWVAEYLYDVQQYLWGGSAEREETQVSHCVIPYLVGSLDR